MKSMKLSELNEALSLLANLGVLIGIVFLILEISQNTRAIENDAFWSRVNSSQAVNSLIVENEEVAELIVKYFQDPKVMEYPITSDLARVRQLLEMIATQSEARFITQSDDLGALRESLLVFLASPGMREGFRSRMGVYTPEFAAFIDELITQSESSE